MAKTSVQERIQRLEAHLKQENPVLAEAVHSFQRLDRIARRLGFMSEDESYAVQVSWWPMIAVLGTFSAGKSTFLNQFVGQDLQRTGNQAVDDRFTVITYGPETNAAVLPGLALDSDPRFPFYQISRSIEDIAEGDGRRIDSYLQLKTCHSEALRGRILIDSPGFDADEQRTSTLHIIDHIIDLSDLVLVFFDARHPEPGAMSDTLTHLVANTVNRPDANKFLYILNQIDNTAREDNFEEVVAAWQRALAQHGLTAGRFYRIFARGAAQPMDNDEIRARLERKRDEDLAEIENRITQVEVERAYRIVGALDNAARHLRDVLIPAVQDARGQWRARTLGLATLSFAVIAVAFLVWSTSAGYWDGLRFRPVAGLSPFNQLVVGGGVLAVAVYLYYTLRRLAGAWTLRTLQRSESLGRDKSSVVAAFRSNLGGWWRSLAPRPRGFGRRTERQLDALLGEADQFIQKLNDRYARPSGGAS